MTDVWLIIEELEVLVAKLKASSFVSTHAYGSGIEHAVNALRARIPRKEDE